MNLNDERICISKKLLISVTLYIITVVISFYFNIIKSNYTIGIFIFCILTSINIAFWGIFPEDWTVFKHYIVKWSVVLLLLFIALIIILIF